MNKAGYKKLEYKHLRALYVTNCKKSSIIWHVAYLPTKLLA